MMTVPLTYPAAISAPLTRPVAERAIEGEYLGRRTPDELFADKQAYRFSSAAAQHDYRQARGRQQGLTDSLPQRQRQLALYDRNGQPILARESFLIDIYA